VQQTAELAQIEMRRQQIPAAEIDHRAVPRLAIMIAIGLDHAEIFALYALADGGSHHAQEHDPVAQIDGKYVPATVSAVRAIRNI
jgi:hypothetical protein